MPECRSKSGLVKPATISNRELPDVYFVTYVLVALV